MSARPLRSPFRRHAALACALCAALSGCASGEGSSSKAISIVSALNPVDALALGAAGYAVYAFAQVPAWTARVEAAPGAPSSSQAAVVSLEKSRFSQGGDGAASMVFAMASKKWCQERGAGKPVTMEFVEYSEPMLVGAVRKARGEIQCAPSAP